MAMDIMRSITAMSIMAMNKNIMAMVMDIIENVMDMAMKNIMAKVIVDMAMAEIGEKKSMYLIDFVKKLDSTFVNFYLCFRPIWKKRDFQNS